MSRNIELRDNFGTTLAFDWTNQGKYPRAGTGYEYYGSGRMAYQGHYEESIGLLPVENVYDERDEWMMRRRMYEDHELFGESERSGVLYKYVMYGHEAMRVLIEKPRAKLLSRRVAGIDSSITTLGELYAEIGFLLGPRCFPFYEEVYEGVRMPQNHPFAVDWLGADNRTAWGFIQLTSPDAESSSSSSSWSSEQYTASTVELRFTIMPPEEDENDSPIGLHGSPIRGFTPTVRIDEQDSSSEMSVDAPIRVTPHTIVRDTIVPAILNTSIHDVDAWYRTVLVAIKQNLGFRIERPSRVETQARQVQQFQLKGIPYNANLHGRVLYDEYFDDPPHYDFYFSANTLEPIFSLIENTLIRNAQ